MDPREVDVLVQRLVANPHDQEVLAYAHQHGQSDPQGYASLLERVGRETHDPTYASHWLSEAANVWSTTMGDAHHAAECLLLAVVKDPTQDVAADRLGQLYREKGDVKGLVALLEKRAKLLGPMAAQAPELRSKLAAMHEELGSLWAEAPLAQPARALDNFRRAYEADPQSVFAIYSARELFKQLQQYAEAIPLFAMEQALITDDERKMALFRDEADVGRLASDLAATTQALRNLRAYLPEEPAVMQEIGSIVLERVQAGEPVPQAERDEAAALLVALAEQYAGEHGFSYSVAALQIDPGHDRAVQLASYFGEQLGREGELPLAWKNYLDANPAGAMAPEIRGRLDAAGGEQAAAAMAAAPEQPQHQQQASEHPQPAVQSEPPPAAEPVRAEPVRAEPAPRASFESVSPERVASMLNEAAQMAAKRQHREAFAKYMDVLQLDPVSPEALSWVDEHLRSRRKWAELRDVYQAAARAPGLAADQRKKYLSNVANICEQQLRDLDGAIQALKQASQIDGAARDHLRRLLEKGQRWDDLAVLLDQEIMDAPDAENQIALLKKLAALHEQKRKDLVAAGESWGRLASIILGDETPIHTAVKLLEKGGRPDLAAEVIADNAGGIENSEARIPLMMKLGELREQSGDMAGAGEAYADAADLGAVNDAWPAAERCFVSAERWEDAARAVAEHATSIDDNKQKATLHAREADYLTRAGDGASAILRLEQAADLDPVNDEYATALEAKFEEGSRNDELIEFILRRAAKLPEPQLRSALRKRAAEMQRNCLSNFQAARDTLLLVLEDGNDAEALTLLADDARSRADYQEEAELLHRLASSTSEPALKAEVVLRRAGVLATDLEDVDAAVDAYKLVLDELEPNNVQALAAMADLEERRDNPKGAVAALERYLQLVTEPEQKVEVGRRLGGLYENTLDDPQGAIRAYEVVFNSDPDDFDAAARLVALCERAESWSRMAELLAVLIEVEGDPEEASVLARRLSTVLHERLDRGQDGLVALESLADEGDEPCREAYVELGDKLAFKGIVAMKLRDWYALAAAPKQHEAFQGAFERFADMGRHADAAQMAVELIRTKGATPELVKRLEELAVEHKDLDALSAAHDYFAKELSGQDRAEEYVRQAEVLVAAGVDPVEAAQHGEQGLTSVPAGEVEQLLVRLGNLFKDSAAVVDLYERQVGRCKAPADKLSALARAAQVAAARGRLDRAKALFELALAGGVREETVESLERAAADGDREQGTTDLRKTLATTFATGSYGSRDGGRTRASLLRRAAVIAHRELGEVEQAFTWLGEALVTHVDATTLDALEELGTEVGDLGRFEAVITKALDEVFDGPLVRQLVGRRAQLRRERLGDLKGASEDLKRLHDLSPSDKAISDDLYALLTELRDYRGMVQLLEDQILRGKDPAQRAELARKAARLWEERMSDARESADAWRRVLRMKAGDPEAQAGLERAKSNMLKKPNSLIPPEPETPAPPPPRMAAPTLPTGMVEEIAPPAEESSEDAAHPSFTDEPEPTHHDYANQDAAPRALESAPPTETNLERPIVERPMRPEISFRHQGEDEPTLSTPAAGIPQQALDVLPARTEEYPAADLAFLQQSGEYVPEDLIESLDEAESVSDDELLDVEDPSAAGR